ncbi:MAG: tetratricopeptide repeat protein [Bdellovibrionales bacterium]
MGRPYKQLVDECEADIRAGRIARVAAKFKTLNRTKIPREWCVQLAKLCRRAGLNSLGLRILTPIVQSQQRPQSQEPTGAELAEYAILLQRNGSVQEALKILSLTSLESLPETHLYKAFCYFSRWEYELSLQSLETYFKGELSKYERLTGLVNLAAAYTITGRHDMALASAQHSLELARLGGHVRLEANSLELLAQIHLQAGENANASRCIYEALKLLDAADVHDTLFLRKWLSWIKAIELNSPAPLRALREEAIQRRHWETAREADMLSLRIAFDSKLYAHLVFGTPYPAYRTPPIHA